MTFEYKVVPAPIRGKKAKGLKTPADRFANALGAVINEMATEGWEYLRADTLPAEERHGLTGRSTVFQNMLIFRRAAGEERATAPESVTETPAASDVVEATKQPPQLSASNDAPVAKNGRTSLFANDRRGDVAAE